MDTHLGSDTNVGGNISDRNGPWCESSKHSANTQRWLTELYFRSSAHDGTSQPKLLERCWPC